MDAWSRVQQAVRCGLCRATQTSLLLLLLLLLHLLLRAAAEPAACCCVLHLHQRAAAQTQSPASRTFKKTSAFISAARSAAAVSVVK